MPRRGDAVTLRAAIERLLDPEFGGEISLVVSEDPLPSVCARHLEDELVARGARSLTYLRGELDESTFVFHAVTAQDRPLVIADPHAALWQMLNDHRARITRRKAPFVIFVGPDAHGDRNTAQIHSLAGANLYRVSGTGLGADDLVLRPLLGDARRVLLTLFDRNALVEMLASDAGVSPTRLRCATPELMAHDLLREAYNLGCLDRVEELVRARYPASPFAEELARIILRISSVRSP